MPFHPDQDDLYEILGVKPEATTVEIKKSYRKLAQRHHPDANRGDKAAEERFKAISAAYDVLKDDQKRAEYDKMRAMLRSGAFGPGAPPGGGDFTINFEDLSDLFGGGLGDLLGNARRGGAGTSTRRGPGRGGDVEANLHLTFEDAMHGVTTQVTVPGRAPCDRCDGSGAEPGTFPKPCPRCGGRGTTSDQQGFFAFSRPCPQCRGEGQVIEHVCSECRGTGAVRRTRNVKVAIPAGVKDGTRVRVKGRGEPGRQGGPSGDLFVKVHVEPHPLFRRQGDDLLLSMMVPFESLALGDEVTAPTLDGTVTLKVPPGTPSGRTFKVGGRGAPHGRGKGNGNLLVTLDVDIPSSLSEDARAALQAYADVRASRDGHAGDTAGGGGHDRERGRKSGGRRR